MSSISSITKAVSGLNAAQKGLQITAHNLSNVNTQGYTRQSLLQSDSPYAQIGNYGGYALKVGLGVTTNEIRQIRNDLIDRRLRSETSVLSYYQTANTTVSDIQAIFDEPYGDTINDMLKSFWNNIQELNTKPDGVTERTEFIGKAQVLIDKIASVASGLEDYQENINKQVITTVGKVNQIFEKIRDLNMKIATAEAQGTDNANDYRDTRNLLIDELSQYGEVSYFEDGTGQVSLQFEGHEVVNKSMCTKIDLEKIEESFVTDAGEKKVGSGFVTLKWHDSGSDVFRFDSIISTTNQNATGSLKAMLAMRGNGYVNSETTWEHLAFNKNVSVDTLGNSYMIPVLQKKLSDFTNKLVTIVNEALDGKGIDGKEGVDVFLPIKVPEGVVKPTLSSPPTEEELKKYNEYNKLLVPGNIMVNPALTVEGGHNRLGTVSGDENNVGDNSTVSKLLDAWQKPYDWYKDGTSAAPDPETSGLHTHFVNMLIDFGTAGEDYIAKVRNLGDTVLNITNERLAMSSVSQDEEFSNMLKYQYAYNASARMVTMLDNMLDTIINKM